MSTNVAQPATADAPADTQATSSLPVPRMPGTVRMRADVLAPSAYAVVDTETTGTNPAVDEIVSLAIVRLDADGVETERYTSLVRPFLPIPAEATAIHGISDKDVADAPRFAEIAEEIGGLLDGAVFVAHNAGFDLAMLQYAFASAGIDCRPAAVACTLEAFRLLEPLAENHRLDTLCERHGIPLEDAHHALGDVLATTALLRVLLSEGFAPETGQLDDAAYMRLRSRGDKRPASEPQIRRVFGMARTAGLLHPDGGVNRAQVVALVERVTGTTDVDSLTREQVQEVYDELERRIDTHREPSQVA